MESEDIFKEVKYQKGFGNTFITEVKEGAVPSGMFSCHLGQNNPAKLKYGLFAEQLSGSAFTVKRAENQKVWYSKVRPSVIEGQYSKA